MYPVPYIYYNYKNRGENVKRVVVTGLGLITALGTGLEKSWKKIKPTKDLLEKMLNAIEIAKQSMQWNKDNGQYIPNPATWLNQKRWEDEIIIDNKYSNKSKNSNNMPSAMTTAQKALDLLEQMGG